MNELQLLSKEAEELGFQDILATLEKIEESGLEFSSEMQSLKDNLNIIINKGNLENAKLKKDSTKTIKGNDIISTIKNARKLIKKIYQGDELISNKKELNEYFDLTKKDLNDYKTQKEKDKSILADKIREKKKYEKLLKQINLLEEIIYEIKIFRKKILKILENKKQKKSQIQENSKPIQTEKQKPSSDPEPAEKPVEVPEKQQKQPTETPKVKPKTTTTTETPKPVEVPKKEEVIEQEPKTPEQLFEEETGFKLNEEFFNNLSSEQKGEYIKKLVNSNIKDIYDYVYDSVFNFLQSDERDGIISDDFLKEHSERLGMEITEEKKAPKIYDITDKTSTPKQTTIGEQTPIKSSSTQNLPVEMSMSTLHVKPPKRKQRLPKGPSHTKGETLFGKKGKRVKIDTTINHHFENFRKKGTFQKFFIKYIDNNKNNNLFIEILSNKIFRQSEGIIRDFWEELEKLELDKVFYSKMSYYIAEIESGTSTEEQQKKIGILTYLSKKGDPDFQFDGKEINISDKVDFEYLDSILKKKRKTLEEWIYLFDNYNDTDLLLERYKKQNTTILRDNTKDKNLLIKYFISFRTAFIRNFNDFENPNEIISKIRVLERILIKLNQLEQLSDRNDILKEVEEFQQQLQPKENPIIQEDINPKTPPIEDTQEEEPVIIPTKPEISQEEQVDDNKSDNNPENQDQNIQNIIFKLTQNITELQEHIKKTNINSQNNEQQREIKELTKKISQLNETIAQKNKIILKLEQENADLKAQLQKEQPEENYVKTDIPNTENTITQQTSEDDNLNTKIPDEYNKQDIEKQYKHILNLLSLKGTREKDQKSWKQIGIEILFKLEGPFSTSFCKSFILKLKLNNTSIITQLYNEEKIPHTNEMKDFLYDQFKDKIFAKEENIELFRELTRFKIKQYENSDNPNNAHYINELKEIFKKATDTDF